MEFSLNEKLDTQIECLETAFREAQELLARKTAGASRISRYNDMINLLHETAIASMQLAQQMTHYQQNLREIEEQIENEEEN